MARTGLFLASGMAAVASHAHALDVEIDAMKHDIRQVTAKSFNQAISNARDTMVGAVWFFYKDQSSDSSFLDTFNEFATLTKSMVNAAAMDCSDKQNKAFCDGEKVARGAEKPWVVMYPTHPMPSFKYEGTMDANKLRAKAFKMITAEKVTVMDTAEKYKEWIKKGVQKPKVVLFSEKKDVPVILKALSKDQVFSRTMDFAFVSKETAPAVVSEAGAGGKKLPAVMLYQKTKKWYKGEMNYLGIHEWINVVSESGMGDTVKGDGAAAPEDMEEMEVERIRELTTKSQRELCFGQKNICAVFLSDGKIAEKDIDMLEGFEKKFAPKHDRGIKYNWMWLDVSVENDFKEKIVDQEKRQAEREDRDVEEYKYPTMIFVKPPKKKREEKMLTYIRHSAGSISESSVADITDLIAGGATYTRADLPKFVGRAKKPAAKKEEL